MTKEDFIKKAQQVHGDKYDYSKVKIRVVKDKIKIICPKHGEFIQEANSHLQGRGCPYCSGKKFHIGDYIDKANEVWNNKYDYSKFKWEGTSKKVCIICPEHGEFWQLPHNHLKGECGCLECRGKSKDFTKITSLDDLISKSKFKFGDKFDFSEAVYIDSRTKIKIICPEHGEFWVLPYQFLQNKCGCPKCSQNEDGLRLRYSQEEFLEICKRNHEIQYDYSLTKYVRSTEKVKVACPTHGEFQMQASAFMRGGNCPKCNFDKLRLTLTEFIKKAELVHGDKYDYSKVEYVNEITPVTIICPIHGEFQQLPGNHLKGCGCKKCSEENKIPSKGEQLISELLNKYSIKYTFQKELIVNKIARNSKILIVDFLVHIKDHFYIIEYNGKQHYQFIPFFYKTEEDFKKQLRRDQLLRDICEKHKDRISLLEIKYNESVDEIESKIKNLFNIS